MFGIRGETATPTIRLPRARPTTSIATRPPADSWDARYLTFWTPVFHFRRQRMENAMTRKEIGRAVTTYPAAGDAGSEDARATVKEHRTSVRIVTTIPAARPHR